MTAVALSREQSRQVDRRAIEEYAMTGLVLMENAGRGVADLLCRRIEQSPRAGHFLICCGKGNNAGDGFVIARHLDLRGHDVRVLVWATAPELTGDAGANFQILQHCGIPIEMFANQHDAARLAEHLAGAAWIVDALLGTGARGEPRPPLDSVIEQLNDSRVPILAVDLPSGLDCDTGQPARRTIRATETCTFVALKRGFLAPEASRYTGPVHVLDIGAPRRLIDEVLNSAAKD